MKHFTLAVILSTLQLAVSSRAQEGKETAPAPTEMVDGIGGVFIFSEDPKRLSDWYQEHLGITFLGSTEQGFFYKAFRAVSPEDPSRALNTNFSIMKATAPLPERRADVQTEQVYGDRLFMVNFQVRDIDATLAHLTAKGVKIIKREEYSYGRFAWVYDDDGNRIELYQPLRRPLDSETVRKPVSPLEQLSWLAGTWRRETAQALTYETWRQLSNSTFEGESFRLAKASGDTVFTESLLLVAMQEAVFYIPKVAENAYPVPFKLTVLEDDRAIFENPRHDFPQRVIYARSGHDAFTATVEGELNGKQRRIDFHFVR